MLPKEECANASLVLKKTINALKQKDSQSLKALSNQTIHSSCTFQDSGTITSAVLIYALSKIVEREDYKKIPNWNRFEKKCISLLKLASSALEKNKHEAYESYIKKARQALENASGSLKPYISEVLKKSSINKASEIYSHGISSEQTAKLLGLTQWEIADYLSIKQTKEVKTKHITVERRAKTALEFFS